MSYFINIEDNNASKNFNKSLKNILKDKFSLKSIVILNIGTDRSTGDCLGALVGYKLKNLKHNNIHIYGNLDNPVHAKNLEQNMNIIKEKHKDSFVIAIDASLSSSDNIGRINISDIPIKPGSGVGKNLPEVGDIAITGVVNTYGYNEFLTLQNTRLNIVMKMADLISSGLMKVLPKVV